MYSLTNVDGKENKKGKGVKNCVANNMTLQKVKRVCALSIKNKFATFEICVGGFNLVIFVSFNKKKLTRLDKNLKNRLYFFLINT